VNTDTHADRFEQRLLAAILDDFPELVGVGVGAGARARGPRPRLSPSRAGTGQARKRGGLVLLAAAAAAASAAGVISGAGHAVPVHTGVPVPAGVPVHAGLPAHLSAEVVVDHVKAAVNASTGRAIQYDLGRAPNSQTGVIENTATWNYATSGREVTLTQVLGAGGSPVLGYLMTATPDTTVTITINYGHRTWSTTTYPWGYVTPPNTPGPLPQTTAQAAAALRAAVTAGSMTEAGPAVVDGQRAIQLVQGSAKTGEIDMWVDPVTYLPIRTIETAPGESPASDRAIRDDYKWLPETAANLSLLTPAGAIPAGFTQVPAA
jgi:hypothetical protein